ncbi:MAG: universal stress protein [Sphingomonadaceae bacterium]|nr:universal stress protein [Sphingomonadaceae bacterium]
MKSVLLHIHRDHGQEARLQAALDIVRTFDGHLTCLQATPFETYIIGDPFGGVYALPQMIAEIRKGEEAERRTIEDRLKREGVSWDWLSYDGSAAKVLADNSWLADLAIVSVLTDKSESGRTPPIAADVVLHARAPVLVVPDEATGFDCSAGAMIAWNGSRESSQALRAALPLLRMADAVTVICVAEEQSKGLPPTAAATFLSRHGVACNLVEQPREHRSVADTLRAAISAGGPGYLVMGAFGHSRLRERVLGGVTHDLLANPPKPLLLAH